MAPRALLVTLLVATAFLAGCTGSDAPAADKPAGSDGAAQQPPAGSDDGAADAQPPAGGAQDGAAPPQASYPPHSAPTADAGEIRGAFDEAWAIEVPSVGARGMTVHFNLTGIEADAPPTAQVTLRLLDPDGKELKRALVGLGGEADAVEWRLQGTDLAGAGAYTLEATADAEPGALPSAGLAKYQLYAYAEY